MQSDGTGLQIVGCLISDRPHVFVADAVANRHFLERIDADYWSYQAEVQGTELASEDPARRRRAAAALRVAYGQGMETLFAFLIATIQCPRFPLGWLLKYENVDLRGAVKKIHEGARLDTVLSGPATWETISAAVHAYVPERVRGTISEKFADVWTRLAEEFLSDSFEPEYNSLKHGMRAEIGGFSVSAGRQDAPGQAAPPDAMRTIGGSEYGSTFWRRPERVDGYRLTFELRTNVTRAWVPEQFVMALQLIGMSIHNVSSRALIASGIDSTTIRFEWPSDEDAYEAPWLRQPSISEFTLSRRADLHGWQEPTSDDIRRAYRP